MAPRTVRCTTPSRAPASPTTARSQPLSSATAATGSRPPSIRLSGTTTTWASRPCSTSISRRWRVTAVRAAGSIRLSTRTTTARRRAASASRSHGTASAYRAADLWVFVTTAARYADAVPWDLLAEAARRRAVVVLVLNRMEPAARTAVTRHLREMLVEHGLDAQVVVVPESRVEGGLLPVAAVAELGGWLRAVVGDVSARDGVVQRTVRDAIDDLLVAAPRLAAAVDGQRRHADRLQDGVASAYAAAKRDVAFATADGTMLRGEVLARWQEFVGTGELLRAVEERVGSWRDRITAALRGRPAPETVATGSRPPSIRLSGTTTT